MLARAERRYLLGETAQYDSLEKNNYPEMSEGAQPLVPSGFCTGMGQDE